MTFKDFRRRIVIDRIADKVIIRNGERGFRLAVLDITAWQMFNTAKLRQRLFKVMYQFYFYDSK